MINTEVIQNAESYRHSFTRATPFRHVLIEDFFSPDVAERLYREFPTFDPRHALNEFGEVGGKAVVTDLEGISPAYRKVYSYLNSREFLDAVSRVTGIDNLLPDPELYGGGTHENIEGQELDPHVDYNYINGGKLHRRLNLLVYFNKEWEPEWGGAIELHSNPRSPEANEVTSFLPLFNRALIFETNEHSWHGFEKIRLPEDRKGTTRKSLAIYLYTRTRPEEEIAPPHGTFYVQRPLPGHIREGHTLTAETLQEIKILLRRRDDWIEFYQNKELEDSRTIEGLRRQLEEARGALARQGRDESGGLPPLSVRLSPAYLARRLYYRLPLSDRGRERLKSFVFTCFGFLFKNRRSYRNWRAARDNRHP